MLIITMLPYLIDIQIAIAIAIAKKKNFLFEQIKCCALIS